MLDSLRPHVSESSCYTDSACNSFFWHQVQKPFVKNIRKIHRMCIHSAWSDWCQTADFPMSPALELCRELLQGPADDCTSLCWQCSCAEPFKAFGISLPESNHPLDSLSDPRLRRITEIRAFRCTGSQVLHWSVASRLTEEYCTSGDKPLLVMNSALQGFRRKQTGCTLWFCNVCAL